MPLLERDSDIRAVTLLGVLEEVVPGFDAESSRRTLERRERCWKALHGPEKDIMFRQEKEPGRFCMSDFTLADRLDVTVRGEHLKHRLYHFCVPYSGWEHAEVVVGGESFVALTSGGQNALFELGGVPREHRADSLSAAFGNLKRDDKEDLRRRYAEFCAEWGMTPTRNNCGEAHENGSIESRHGHLFLALIQALLLRGSRDFDSVDEWRRFVARVVARRNAKRAYLVEAERAHFKPLPKRRSCDYDEARVKVTSSSCFTYQKALHSTHSRLIGHTLVLRVHDDRIDAYVGGELVQSHSRRRLSADGPRHVVDYRHFTQSLRKKPGAFANWILRDAAFPRDKYRRCWEALEVALPTRKACKTMVGLLRLAHEHVCEVDLAQALEVKFDAGRVPDFEAMESRLEKPAQV